jgi:hypothetical protein
MKPDLIIELQQCKGRADFFVSTDFSDLWNDENAYSKIPSSKGSELYGTLSYRVTNYAAMPALYIGVASTNELFRDLKDLEESHF